MAKKSKIKLNKIASPDEVVLDDYEQELEDALEKGYKRGNLTAERKKFWEDAAKIHTQLQKSKKITLTVKSGELLKFRAAANSKGIPYQTLMNVMIKQYNDGDISVGL